MEIKRKMISILRNLSYMISMEQEKKKYLHLTTTSAPCQILGVHITTQNLHLDQNLHQARLIEDLHFSLAYQQAAGLNSLEPAFL